MVRSRDEGELLPGEWACLACVAQDPAHGFGVAARLAPTGDLGRVVPLSRPLTYRSLEQLHERGLVEVVGEERGRTGGTRTIYGATAAGRAALDAWLDLAVPDVRELLLKLVVGDALGRDRAALVAAHRDVFGATPAASDAPVDIWDEELSAAVQRLLDRLARPHGASPA